MSLHACPLRLAARRHRLDLTHAAVGGWVVPFFSCFRAGAAVIFLLFAATDLSQYGNVGNPQASVAVRGRTSVGRSMEPCPPRKKFFLKKFFFFSCILSPFLAFFIFFYTALLHLVGKQQQDKEVKGNAHMAARLAEASTV